MTDERTTRSEAVRLAAGRAVPALAVAAILVWADRTGAAAVAAGTAGLLVAAGAALPRAFRRFDALVVRLAGDVAAGAGTAIAGIVWVLMLLPIWALSRLVGYSPIDVGWTTPCSAWTSADLGHRRGPDRRVRNADRASSADPKPGPGQRVQRRLRAALLAALAFGLVVTLSRPWSATVTTEAADRTTGESDVRSVSPAPENGDFSYGEIPLDGYAYLNAPFARQLFQETNQQGSELRSDPVVGVRMRDFSGRYVNVIDGRRVSYTPDDPTLDVWFFGGSTMFGIGQRDDHTIPSVVTRLAERDGIRIRATNFGVSADVNWQATIRFAEALDNPDLPDPDLVVFYDGWNDQTLGEYRAEIGSLDPTTSERLPFSDLDREREGVILGGRDRLGPGPERTALAIPVAAAQYARGVRTARMAADAEGIEIAHFWQPIAGVKQLTPADDRLVERTGLRPEWRDIRVADYAAIRTLSGVDPIDLSTVMDDVDRPVYFDHGHTNEFGAEVVATAMHERLRNTLTQLDEER